MSLRKSLPETMINQSTAPQILFMQPKTKLTAMWVALSDNKAIDLQSPSEEEYDEQKKMSKQPKTTMALEASSDKEAVDSHRMIPNLLPSMIPI
jgi:hypothetical protein